MIKVMYLVQTYTDFTLKIETNSNYAETYESGEKIGDKFEGKRCKPCNKPDIAGSSPVPATIFRALGEHPGAFGFTRIFSR